MRGLFLLIVLLAGTALGQDAAALRGLAESIRGAKNSAEAGRAIPSGFFSEASADRERIAGLRRTMLAGGESGKKAQRSAANLLDLLARANETRTVSPAPELARKIKAGVAYREATPDASSNWIGRMFKGLRDWISNLFKRNDQAVNLDPPRLSLPGGLIYVVYALAAIVVLVAAWPLVRLIRFRMAKRARKAGLLEEEPERSRSEYLLLADEFAAKGEFRQAIRMMYLATLKRFDEARVARFDRGETNWEHLARIERAANLPTGLDFRPATQAFDFYWYGHRPAAAADYAQFVAWNEEADRRLAEVVR